MVSMRTGDGATASGINQVAAAIAAAVAGVLFVGYPLLRPWSDEQGSAGAQALASGAWVGTHAAAMIGFILLPIALRQLGPRLGSPWGILLATVGSGAVLPYYGAEAFGIQAIAGRASGDPALLELLQPLRFGAVQLTFFGIGLVALAVGGIMQAVRILRRGGRDRWLGVPLGLGLGLLLPQFFAVPGVRIAHGLLMGLGGICLAVILTRRGSLDAA